MSNRKEKTDAERLRELKALQHRVVELEKSNEEFRQAAVALRKSMEAASTERKNAELALLTSETKFTRAFFTSPDSININRLRDGLFLEINQGFTDITGYTVEDVAGKTSLEINIWDNPKDRARLVEGLRTQGEVKNLEAAFRMKDGRKIIGLMSARVFELDGQQCILSVTRDISQRKRAEEGINKFFEQSLVMLFIADMETNTFVRVNSEVARVTGRTTKELLSVPFIEFVHPQDQEKTKRMVASLAEGDSVIGFRNRYLTAEGDWRILEWTATPDTDRKLMYAIARDVTQQVRGERLLGALNQAAKAMDYALQTDEIFKAVGDELNKVGLFCTILSVDEIEHTLTPKYLSYEAGVMKIVHKLVKMQYNEFSFAIDAVEIFEEVVEKKRAILVANPDKPIRRLLPSTLKPLVRQITKLLNIARFIATPLIMGGRVVGVLSVQSDDLIEADIPAITAFGNQVAAAWRKAQMYQNERAQTELATTLREASQVMGASLELNTILRLILDQLKRILVFDTASVHILREGRVPDLVVGVGYQDEQYTSREAGKLLQASPILAQMARDLKPVVSEDVHQLEGWIWVPGAEHVRSFLCVPLVARSQMIGALMADHSEKGRFAEKDVEVAQILARHAAQAIENASLFEQAQREIADRVRAEEEIRRRAAQQEALNAIIMAAASAAMDLPTLLKNALEHTLAALELRMGVIWCGGSRILQGFPPDSEVAGDWVDELEGLEIHGPFIIEGQEPVVAASPPSVLASILKQLDVSASLTVPILDEGRPIGGLVLATAAPRHWSHEEVALVEAVGRQLGSAAERLRLLAQIQEQAGQLQQVMDTVPDGVLLLDSARRLVLANPAAQGYVSSLAGEIEVGDILTRLGDRSLEMLLELPSDSLSHELESDESVFEVIARPIPADPTIGGWVMVIRDVSQEREVQERAQHQERLAAVGQLAAGIAHDFNNIMAVITLYAQLSSRVPDVPSEIAARMDTIIQQSKRAATLINQILDFSRRAVLERKTVDLEPVLKEQVKLLQRTLPETIAIDLVFEGRLRQYAVDADLTRMQQMVMNLAVNARDAMPEGGVLRIGLSRVTEKARCVTCTEIGEADWVRLTVSDTGMGIPAEALAHVFEPFFTTKEIGKGSGLGLAQVYGIVKQHDGHVDVSTGVGKGTIFTVYLPAMQLPESSPEIKETPAMVGEGQTILVVEDDPAVREALVGSLDELSYQTLEAQNGQDALEVIEQHQDLISLVVSDLVMPQMGGDTLAAVLGESYPTIPVILLSGYPLEDGDAKTEAAGVFDWLQKPVDLNQLAQAVTQALARKR